MPVISQSKTGPNDTIVVLQVPDAILATLVENVQRLEQGWAWEDKPIQMPPPTTRATPATAPPKLPGAASALDVKTIHQIAQAGEPMKDSQRTRVIEVLGRDRAEAIFGPGFSFDAFKLFRAADPKTLQRDANGKWQQVDNPNWDQALLTQLLEFDITQLAGSDQDIPFDDDPVPPPTPEMQLAQIQGDSYRGQQISEPQRKFLEGVIKGAFAVVFPGRKRGDGNSAVNAYTTLASKRIRDAAGEYRDNPNYSPAFVAHVQSKLKA